MGICGPHIFQRVGVRVRCRSQNLSSTSCRLCSGTLEKSGGSTSAVSHTSHSYQRSSYIGGARIESGVNRARPGRSEPPQGWTVQVALAGRRPSKPSPYPACSAVWPASFDGAASHLAHATPNFSAAEQGWKCVGDCFRRRIPVLFPRYRTSAPSLVGRVRTCVLLIPNQARCRFATTRWWSAEPRACCRDVCSLRLHSFGRELPCDTPHSLLCDGASTAPGDKLLSGLPPHRRGTCPRGPCVRTRSAHAPLRVAGCTIPPKNCRKDAAVGLPPGEGSCFTQRCRSHQSESRSSALSTGYSRWPSGSHVRCTACDYGSSTTWSGGRRARRACGSV